MFVLSIIFFSISIVLCFLVTISFVGYVVKVSREEIGYKPLQEVIESSYTEGVLLPVNQKVFIKNADNLLHGNQS